MPKTDRAAAGSAKYGRSRVAVKRQSRRRAITARGGCPGWRAWSVVWLVPATRPLERRRPALCGPDPGTPGLMHPLRAGPHAAGAPIPRHMPRNWYICTSARADVPVASDLSGSRALIPPHLSGLPGSRSSDPTPRPICPALRVLTPRRVSGLSAPGALTAPPVSGLLGAPDNNPGIASNTSGTQCNTPPCGVRFAGPSNAPEAQDARTCGARSPARRHAQRTANQAR